MTNTSSATAGQQVYNETCFQKKKAAIPAVFGLRMTPFQTSDEKLDERRRKWRIHHRSLLVRSDKKIVPKRQQCKKTRTVRVALQDDPTRAYGSALTLLGGAVSISPTTSAPWLWVCWDSALTGGGHSFYKVILDQIQGPTSVPFDRCKFRCFRDNC